MTISLPGSVRFPYRTESNGVVYLKVCKFLISLHFQIVPEWPLIIWGARRRSRIAANAYLLKRCAIDLFM